MSKEQDFRNEVFKANRMLEKAQQDLHDYFHKPKHRFYKGQPVLVRDESRDKSFRRYYAQRRTGLDYCYGDGTTNVDETEISTWDGMKPDPEAPSLLNWIEHDGVGFVANNDNFVVTIDRDDRHGSGFISAFDWSHQDTRTDIMRYAIIPEIEWCD